MADETPIQEVAAEEVAVVEEEAPLNQQTALQAVLRTSLFHDGLARGLKEVVKALDRREAHLCVLAGSCNEAAYVKLVTALCAEHEIPLLKIDDGKTLGEWAGLCKYNEEGTAVKVVGCSSVVVKSWGEETPAKAFVLDLIAKGGN